MFRAREASGAIVLIVALVLANVAVWMLAFALFRERPAVLATASLAWVLGLRHAVDADHIAAIDNVVRRLVHAGEPARQAGLYFSLGHSTVVFVATFLVTMAAVRLGGSGGLVEAIGSLIGAAVSALFLLLVAGMNLVILVGLCRTLRAMRATDRFERMDHDAVPGVGGGLLARLLGPAFRVVGKAWHMYPLGFLFGLGFDTATEIGLLSLSAEGAARGLSPWSVLIFPALFTAAMSLIDTADSVLMVGAYRWAIVDPLRRLRYNLTITGASVLIAIVVGGVEALNLLGKHLGVDGRLWAIVAAANENLANLGMAAVGAFVLIWGVSIGLYRTAFYEKRS